MKNAMNAVNVIKIPLTTSFHFLSATVNSHRIELPFVLYAYHSSDSRAVKFVVFDRLYNDCNTHYLCSL